MSGQLQLLGPVEPFKGPQVAGVGEWLVVFKNNAPKSLFDVGRKARKGLNTPMLGVQVARLTTEPRSVILSVDDAPTADGFYVKRLSVEVDVRLTPENPEGARLIMDLIRREGHAFGRGIEARLSAALQVHVRTHFKRHTAEQVAERGPMAVLFPQGNYDVHDPMFEVSSVHLSAWDEAEFAAEIRKAAQEAAAGAVTLAFERSKLDREVSLDLQRQANEEALATRRLQALAERARTLGLNAAALAEPELWRAMSADNRAVAEKLLESNHLFPLLRSNPQLLDAIAYRLQGGSSAIAMGRQADLVLDQVEPARIHAIEGSTVWPSSRSDAALDEWRMFVDPVVKEAWDAAGQPEALAGAGWAEQDGAVTVILLGRDVKPNLTPAFKQVLAEHLAGHGLEPRKIDSVSFHAANMREAVDSVIKAMLPDAALQVELSVREISGRRELLAEIRGDHEAARTVFTHLTNPANPIVPTLERLVNNSAQVRFALPIGEVAGR